MMKRFSFIRILAVALVIGLMVVGVAAQEERVLVIGHAESTDSLDPARGYTQTTGIINRATYSTLVTFPDDGPGDILPWLATAWEISEDGLSYTFTLREGVTFVSGNPVTAADVVFS
ncbi:MAG: ABC transporter substrate-binding protein, partial [Phototrophicaceae bacterium]